MFKCRLDLIKSTEGKLRWDEEIDGTTFELYIPKWRVPEPVPPMISVKIYDGTAIDTSAQLSPSAKNKLISFGLSADEVRELGNWLPIERTPPDGLKRPIIAVVEFERTHTQTVRYSPVGDPKGWEIGQPYVPISELGFPYPKRLILRVTWEY
jgi:hypothetical protein